MAYEQRSYSGNAPPTALSSGITASALSVSVVDGTGYPTGSDGPFFIVIDPGTALEEKVLVTSRSTNAFTVATVGDRGADSTTQQAHGAGAVVQHVHTARDAAEANQAVVHGIARVQAKGDLVVGTETRTTGRLAVGSAGNDALIVDAGTPTGVRWGKAAPATHDHSPGQGGAIPPTSVTGMNAHIDATVAHGATGAVVGTTNTQILTNKTLTVPTITGGTQVQPNIADPNITDRGLPVQGTYRCTSLTRPTGVAEGTLIWETDTHRYVQFDGTNWLEVWARPQHSGWFWGSPGYSWAFSTGGWNEAPGSKWTRPCRRDHLYLMASTFLVYPSGFNGMFNVRASLHMGFGKAGYSIHENHLIIGANSPNIIASSGTLQHHWHCPADGDYTFFTAFAAGGPASVVNSYSAPTSAIYDLGALHGAYVGGYS